MIVLDTNVVSEIIGPSPAKAVLDWFENRDTDELRLTSITKAELLFGIECLPQGRKRDQLKMLVDEFLNLLGHEVLSFAGEHAAVYAAIAAGRRSRGRPVGELDAQIAAIARLGGFSVATRNVKDFADCGIEIINPWDAA